MNISAAKTSDSSTTKVETTEKTKTETAVKKTEENKTAEENKKITEKNEDSQKQESEFKKLIEPQNQDKTLLEQQNQQNLLNPNIQNENFANKFSFDVGSAMQKYDLSLNFNTTNISKDDAKFFADLVDNKQFAVQDNGNKTNIIKFTDEVGPTYKTQQASKTLASLIEKAYNEQKPVRIDFDNNVSVIMKIDKKGKISAEFIPGDKAVEEYLRNNIRSLKQRFDDQNLPYNDLFYRQSRNSRQQQQQRNNKGE